MKAMIVLGFDCGLRVSEVASLKIKCIRSSDGLIFIYNSKRNHSRNVKLSPFCLSILREYWKVYRPVGEYLFPSPFKKCKFIATSTINRNFRDLLNACGIKLEFSCFHALRDTYATNMLRLGCDPFLLRKMLGHKSFSSTARYISMNHNDIIDSFSISDKKKFSI